jgi:putative ABC transport system permease protein
VNQLPTLDFLDLAIALVIPLACAAIFFGLRLPAAPQLLVASLRATLQILVLGIFLSLVMAGQPGLIAIGCGVLFLVVTIATSNRLGSGKRFWVPVGASLLFSTLLVVGFTYLAIGRGQIPLRFLPVLVGIFLAASPGLLLEIGRQFLQLLQREQGAIETHLSLGASGSQAVRTYQRQALQQVFQPTIQTLAFAGLATIPSMMAGMVLAGLTPLQAAAYQIVLLALTIGHQILAAGLLLLSLTKMAFDAQERPIDLLQS